MRYMDDEELMESFLKNCCVIGVDLRNGRGDCIRHIMRML